MKEIREILLLITLILAFNACSKEDDNDSNNNELIYPEYSFSMDKADNFLRKKFYFESAQSYETKYISYSRTDNNYADAKGNKVEYYSFSVIVYYSYGKFIYTGYLMFWTVSDSYDTESVKFETIYYE